MHRTAQRNNCEQQLEIFAKATVRTRTRADHGHPFVQLKQLRTGCLSILMFLTPLAEVNP